ncbi:uncharacterized protein MELLADRAFT_101006 [Melampsora larici-populina 98AG31]|uniref:Uncharacterized protein n=1 Tax=Melampsora larici-populina (strain 98AG31 / pathotype 3-4-7) TaxID=747676 RepID=F4R3B0_MELLP|nr:uncharacterized protein MELLADRAFT_101006 [Melampsora larici-populina 98AG31]EGG13201.1 hypothetical protein MELLADRAFT_101006 [Melampsora larici-populina 98AG31]
MAHQNPQRLDEYDPIFEALERCSQTSSSYEGQRSSKVPTRSPPLPLSPNFRQRVVYSSVDGMGEANISQTSENQTVTLRSKTHEKVLPIPLVKETPDEYDAIFEALDRCCQTSSSYQGQRSSKVPTRSPPLPLSPNLRQRVVYSSVDEMGEANINQTSDNQTVTLRPQTHEKVLPIPLVKETLDVCDPLLVAIGQYIHTPTPSKYTQQRSDDRIVLLAKIARYTDTTTSFSYAQQRSPRACIGPAPALENAIPDQRLTLAPDQGDVEAHVGDSREDEFVSLACDHGPGENDQKSGQPSHYPHLSIEVPSHFLQIDTDSSQCKPDRASRVHQSRHPNTVLSNVSTPRAARSSSRPPHSMHHQTTPLTPTRHQHHPRSEVSLASTLRPVGPPQIYGNLPSPSALSINRRIPSGEVLAGLDFMAKPCARRTPDASLDLERSETPESSGAFLLS